MIIPQSIEYKLDEKQQNDAIIDVKDTKEHKDKLAEEMLHRRH